MPWYALYVENPARFRRAKGCEARPGELYMVTCHFGSVTEEEHRAMGLARMALPGMPNPRAVVWDEKGRRYRMRGVTGPAFIDTDGDAPPPWWRRLWGRFTGGN